ncbi:MAG: OmpA family protein [Flavobacteriales bacterium]|nr:OmpA family protein [Flavobacteriales bacterium]
MRLFKILSSFSLSVLFVATAFAQKNYAKEADAAFLNEQYFTAKDLYKTAAEKEKKIEKKLLYLFRVGECYRFLTDVDQAETYYQRVVDGNYKDAIVWLRLADAQREQGKYKDAEKNYQKYFEKSGDVRGQTGAEACKLSQEWMKNKTRHIIDAEQVLNTEFYDFSPTFADKKSSEMVFSSSRQGGIGTEEEKRTGGGRTDLWVTIRDKKGKWGEPTPMPQGVNTEDNEGAAVFDRKGEVMYYTNCPNEKKKNLGCDIYFVERKGDKWGTPEKMNLKGNNDSVSVGHPALTNDDQVLIFASDMDGGQGGKDLWMVTYDKRAKSWSDPVNLGPKINTPGDEMFPYIHDDGSLYFSSDGHLGMGGLDIFRAEQVGNEKKWDNPKNLGFPMNSPQHDFGIVFEAKEKGFFTSNRVGGKGRDDIYSFMLPPLLFELKVTVLDDETKQPIKDIEVKLAGTDNSNVVLKTNEAGLVSFVTTPDQKRFVNENVTYTVESTLPKGFLKSMELKKQFSTVGVEKSTNWEFTFYMKKVTPKTTFRLPMIVYAYDKADLIVDPTGNLKENETKRPVNSEDSLLYLYNLMVENPTIKVQLRSHTDFRGNDAYNEKLSQRRAETCVKYLISKGISKERITAKGMGEKAPNYKVSGKDTIYLTEAYIKKIPSKEEQNAYHQMNRRTDFKIISFDYVPTEADLKLQWIDLPWMKKAE